MPNISKIKVGNITYDLPCGEVITITSASGTLTQEVYDKIISSPFNKIKYLNKIYILQEENSTSYVYTSNYLTNGNRITITKSNRAISSGSLGAITSHYEAHNYIGAKDTQANGTTTNGNTYLKLYESGAKRSQFKIKGTGETTVTSDKDGNVTIHSSSPFLSLGLGQTTYPITGDFTEEQADKLISAPFSTITFSPGGSPDSVPMLPQTSEQSHYSYIWKGSDANYTYTINATLNRTSDGHGGLVWMSKSYTITRETKSSTVTSVNGQTGAVVIDIPEGATAISTEDINAICSQVILNSEDVDL